MPGRTTPADATALTDADELEAMVQDKRAGWRGCPARGRRRQRGYKTLLTARIARLGPEADDDPDPDLGPHPGPDRR